MDKFTELVTKNWTVFQSAPFAFLALFIFAASSSFFVTRFFYIERIEVLKERLLSKDDQINEYRQRLHLVDTDKTSYSQLSNAELGRITNKLADRIRDYASQRQQQDMSRSIAEQEQMLRAKTEEEKKKVWNEFTSSMLVAPPLNIEYSARFHSEPILVRDELLSRLPPNMKDPRAFDMYEFPTNPIGLGMIADDLDKLSKSLPN